jgi:hypothetical protein
MSNNESSSTSTTVPSPTTTVPPPVVKPDASGGVTLPSLDIKPSYAGGIDPFYKAPDKSVFNNKTNPYLYKSDDWQIILKTPKDQVVGLQNKLMQAFPGWKPDVLGRINDDKTIRQSQRVALLHQ